MSEPGVVEAWEVPLAGAVPFDAPTDRLHLHHGPIRLRTAKGETDIQEGAITLVFRSGTQLLWAAGAANSTGASPLWRYTGDHEPVTLVASIEGTNVEVEAHLNGDGEGFFGRPSASGTGDGLVEVKAQWANLPPLPATGLLREAQSEKGWVQWRGRWARTFREWHVEIDERPDIRPAIAEAKRQRLFTLTHTMRIRRVDGRPFTADDAKELLDGLQLAFSFALGRWAAPVLPLGYDVAGELTWSWWSPVHVDSPAKSHGRWWVEHRGQDVHEFLDRFLDRWLAQTERHTLSFVTSSAIAAGESGFVEQRIMTALAALEHLAFLALGDEGELPRRDRSGARRLRRLLEAARVPLAVSRSHQPILRQYADGGDGPRVLVDIRNRITHPRTPRSLYETPGLLGEASRLASRYLDLVLLHHLGYTGHTADRTITTGWSGDSAPVPWASVRAQG